MVAEIKDGVDGWELLDYTWDPATGVGRYEYQRRCEDTDGTPNAGTEGVIINRAQPYSPAHVGWYTGART